MINYIAKIFEFLFKPYWLREYLNDEAIEDIQNLETEEVEDDNYINIKYKDNRDICIQELENFLKTMNLCDHNPATYLDEMVGLENEIIDEIYVDSSDSDIEIEMGFEVD